MVLNRNTTKLVIATRKINNFYINILATELDFVKEVNKTSLMINEKTANDEKRLACL